MNTMPKSLAGFYVRYAFKEHVILLSLWGILFIAVQVGYGVFSPLIQKWFIAIFEQPAPFGMGLMSFAMPTILTIAGIMLLLRIMGMCYAWIFYGILSPKVSNELSQALNDYVHTQSMTFYISRNPGKINSQISYISGALHIFRRMLSLLTTLASILFNVGLIVFINKWVALVIGFAFVFRMTYGIWRMRPMNRAAKSAASVSSSLAGKVIDSLSNFSVVKLFANATTERMFLKPMRNDDIKARRHSSFMLRIFWAIPSIIDIFLMGATMILCVYLYTSGNMKISEIVYTITAYLFIMEYISNIVENIPELIEAIGSAQQSYKELIKPIEVMDINGARPLTVTHGKIEIRNVTFAYGRKKVLDNMSLVIRAGEKVGLVGSSGAGKTTLVNLLMRFYDPKKGQILIDDQDIHNVTQDSLRQNITFIPQEPALFNRTLLDNISYGKPDATLAQVRDAAKKAAADGFIMETTKKYDSMVGDRGIKLSGGQRQRVAIARAFLKDAPILILDEATSALDSETEAAIQESFEKLSRGRTTVAIAHRLSTLRNMDRIIVMDGGRIIESGTHTQLVRKRGGVYAKLWKMQSGGFIQE